MGWDTTLLPAAPNPGFSDFFSQLREEQRRKEQFRAEVLLKQRQMADNERQTGLNERQLKIQENGAAQAQAIRQAEAREKIAAAIDAGRPDLAKQIAAAHNINLKELADTRPDKDRLMAPSFETAPTGQAPADLDLDKADKFSPSYDPKAVQAHEDAIAAYTASQFQPAGYAPPRRTQYEIAGQGYDPDQRRTAREKQSREAFKSFPEYADRAAALAQAPEDVAKDVQQQFLTDDRAQAAQDRAVAAAERKAALDAIYRDTPQDRMDRTTVSAMTGLEGRKVIGNAMGGSKADQNTLGAAKYIGQKVKDQIRSSGYAELRKGDQTLAKADAQLDSGAGSGQFGALQLIGQAMRGGMSTQYTTDEEKKHLSGIVGRIEGIISSSIDGTYSPEQIATAKKEVAAGRALMSQLVDRAGQALAITLREDPMVENLKGTANAEYKAAMTGIGRPDAPALFPDETNNVPALGSNIVKGGGTYTGPAQAGEQQPGRVSVSGPLGAFQGAFDAGKARDARRVSALTGAPEDVNSEAPLPEDPTADSIDDFQKPQPQSRQAAPRPPTPKARTNYGKVSEAQVRERARHIGMNPEEAVARARAQGLIQ